MNTLLHRFEIHDEPGVLHARQEARIIAERLGFSSRDRLAIASAVTHVACEAVRHAGGAVVEFRLGQLEGDLAPALQIEVDDLGSTDRDPCSEQSRDYKPANHWLDRFTVDAPDGRTTRVSMARRLPARTLPLDPSLAARIAEELCGFHPLSMVSELLDHDLALFRSFDEIGVQRQDLTRLKIELDESRRAVLALHDELGDWADRYQLANELKTRFLSRLSHELRTPLASILGLARLLLGRADGELGFEQERQVSFILRAAHDLSALINTLLDLARMESGHEILQITPVALPEFFAGLRGMFRPLVTPGSAVALIFEEPVGLSPIWTDAGKLTQILRNFVSNALKFTDHGEIRVKAEAGPESSVIFSVIDTGLGIAREDLDRVFEEFSQIDGPHPFAPNGTGLGLPLARKLAEILGGRVEVRSDPGVGSTFTVTVPDRKARPSVTDDCPTRL